MTKEPLPVVLLTDFGTADDFAGVCHGVIAMRAPGAPVIHLTHGITPQDVAQGARVLRAALPYTPRGVYLGVVDPGVGTERRGIAVRSADGRLFVGPDNGLLVPAVEAAGGAVEAASIESAGIVLSPVSATFHGRDVFSPAAAALAGGAPLSALGPAVDVASLRTVELTGATFDGDDLVAHVWQIDRFGNAALDIAEEQFAQLVECLDDDNHLEVRVRGDRLFASVAKTFASVRRGELLVYLDAYRTVALAVNRGQVTDVFQLGVGSEVILRVV